MQRLLVLCLLITTVFMLPLDISLFNSKEGDTRIKEEYDVYLDVIEHYESLVDNVISSESEDFLIELIHMPKVHLNKALKIQGNALGIHNLSYPQIVQMPAIIGKHIHLMNSELYASIEPIVTHYWRMARIMRKPSLTTLNGILAQDLLEKIDDYDLSKKIKQDIQTTESSRVWGWKYWIYNWFSNQILIIEEQTLELNFLKQYVSDIKTSLLLEFHVQFMDFYTRIQSDQSIEDVFF